jgi:hypothetical protein
LISPEPPSVIWQRKTTIIAALSVLAILLHVVLRFGFHTPASTYQVPLYTTLVLGLPLIFDLLRKLLNKEFGSDMLGFHHHFGSFGGVSRRFYYRFDALRR